MFEYDQAIVDTLLHDNQRFQELYNQHHKLKEKSERCRDRCRSTG